MASTGARKRVRIIQAEDDDDSLSTSPSMVADKPQPRLITRTFVPKMDSYEHTNKRTGLVMITLMIGLPGLQSGDVTISLLHDKLTISGKTTEHPLGEGNCVTRSRELQRGKFSRMITVPLGMKLDDFKARMENGLLTVTFPKDPPEQKPNYIPIESA